MRKKLVVSVTHANERISIKKKQLTCVLCLSFVVHRLIYGRFMGCNATGFLSLPGLVQRSLTDPPKENGRKFAPTAPIASKFRLGNT